MKDYLNILAKGRRPNNYESKEDDLNILEAMEDNLNFFLFLCFKLRITSDFL